MKKWGKYLPALIQLATIICLVLAGIATQKWG